MIVVDSSVWIERFRRQPNQPEDERWQLIDVNHIVVGDVVLLELLRGARSDTDASRIDGALSVFRFATMLDRSTAVEAAGHYRHLRSLGITIRNSADLVIAAFCIRNGHMLFQQDRDFLPMAEHCGLQLL